MDEVKNAFRQGRLMTVDETAERFGTSPRMVRRLVTQKRIEVVRIGRHIRISERAADALIEAGTQKAATAS